MSNLLFKFLYKFIPDIKGVFDVLTDSLKTDEQLKNCLLIISVYFLEPQPAQSHYHEKQSQLLACFCGTGKY
jgi:hypothetical protein